jgi:hypothetical protein
MWDESGKPETKATYQCATMEIGGYLAYIKRTAPPKVEPVVYEGVRFTTPNDNGVRAYVQAWDGKTGRKLWEVRLFRNFIKPW